MLRALFVLSLQLWLLGKSWNWKSISRRLLLFVNLCTNSDASPVVQNILSSYGLCCIACHMPTTWRTPLVELTEYPACFRKYALTSPIKTVCCFSSEFFGLMSRAWPSTPWASRRMVMSGIWT
ncbi:hypothetical protein BDZ45DRAFT_808722 [Acephala macrosclerotiorum]|nr:hypothetical protein BDZ45DRAFT_808722 [Acephala macrosclerotiorum]